jgi:plasmid stabilization system protein ParE
MAFHVELSERSQRDIEAAYEYIAAEASQAAADFRYGLQAQINFLKVFPLRCGLAL